MERIVRRSDPKTILNKTIYTLNVDGYAPEITELTYPLLKRYADKIDADFCVIDTRQFLKWPVTYEKLQIFYLAAERKDDWSIYIDSDALVLPEMFDVTEHLSKKQLMHWGVDFSGNRWTYDKYFRRDGRHVSSCNWFTVASDWCRDLWRPLDDLSPAEAVENIRPTWKELQVGITREHLIDDYTLSRNIAKYGLHVTTLHDLQKEKGIAGTYFHHQYMISTAEKAEWLSKLIDDMGLR